MKCCRFGLFLVFLELLPFFFTAQAQESSSYFYRGLSYGSEATFNPISLILNGGFDELQAYGVTNTFSHIPWKDANESLWKNLRDPFSQIDKYGWGRFLSDQVLPMSLNKFHMQYFPNYTLHLLGGGMAFRKMEEWYAFHQYPAPRVFGAVTAMSYHYINELIETRDYGQSNVDPIADLYIFDPLGIFLFSFDGVAEFFSTELQFNDWSSQPAFSFAPFALRNASQNFVMKYPLPLFERTSLFYHFGSFGLLGLSFKTNEEESVSFGAGLTSKSIITYNVNRDFVAETIETGGIVGIYFDRNNSLLASLVVADNFNERIRLNVFPGLIFVAGISPGFFLSTGDNSICTMGVTLSTMPAGLSAFLPR